MKANYVKKNRERLAEILEDNSSLVISSGYLINKSADEAFVFKSNSNFYYLTGIIQEDSYLIITKANGVVKETLLISDFDEFKEKWTGKMLTHLEAEAISGITQVVSSTFLDNYKFNLFSGTRNVYGKIEKVYLDLEQEHETNYNNFGLTLAREIRNQYPHIDIKNAFDLIVSLRSIKQKYEIDLINESIDVTRIGLDSIMKHLAPGMYEYQTEAYYDFEIKTHGNKAFAFPTIAASGVNATTLHYETNANITNDGELILFDLGCKTEEYCSDISRTYPINGKFTERQKQIYEIVLKCNKLSIEYAKPGMTFKEFNSYARSILIEEAKKIGLIVEDNEIDKYYYHSVSHSLGIDTHDPYEYEKPIQENMVITVEPGLYIKEEKIGIRIEDDILVKKTGNVCLSKDIIKEVCDIENFMKK